MEVVWTVFLITGQGPTALAVDVGEGCLDIFLSTVISLFFLPFSKCLRSSYRVFVLIDQ